VPWFKKAALWLLAVGMMGIGATHFVNPDPFLRIMPEVLPAHRTLVYVSGLFEIAGGVGLLIERTRRAAAWGLIALYVAVFPANLNMALLDIQLDPASPMPSWVAWARLPFQLVFIAWAYWFTRPVAVVASAKR
jgi:uncharacterized membrane protein